MSHLEWTGERLTTALENYQGVFEHLHRYAIVQDVVANKKILDIASGEGYGSALLSKYANFVTGVDIDSNSIKHASKKYQKAENLNFIVGSTDCIPLADHSVDIVVSFETLEHHDKHDLMMTEINRVLVKGGTLVISSPEKSIYSEREANNPFHVKELALTDFELLLKKFFKNVKIFEQRFIVGSFIDSLDKSNFGNLKFYSGNYENINSDLEDHIHYNKPYFNIAVCSNSEIDDTINTIGTSLFDGVNAVKREIADAKQIAEFYKAECLTIRNSKSFRIGHFITKKINYFLKFWK